MLEVTKEELTEAHPSYADIVGRDVCVLPGDTLGIRCML